MGAGASLAFAVAVSGAAFGAGAGGTARERGGRAAARAALSAIDPALQPYRFGGRGAGAFNEPIPGRMRTDRHSRAVMAHMLASMRRERLALVDRGGVPGVYRARRRDPWYLVRAGGRRFHWRVPAGVTPGGSLGEDAPVVIQDPHQPRWGRQVELRLWRTRIDRGRRTVDAQGFGIFRYGRRSNGRPVRGQGTGSGLPWVGLLRAGEVRRGAIRHALRLVAPEVSRRHRLPARTSDQRDRSPLVMGMRLQLDRRVNCGRRTVPGRSRRGSETRFLRMVCVALQRYGAIVADGTRTPNLYSLQMELDRSAGGAVSWRRVAGRPPGGYWGNVIRDARANATGDGLARRATDGIPWGRVRVLSRSVFSR